MKTKFICLLLILVLTAACGRSSARRDQQQYETVSEGSASGVTSTIHGPGDTLPPITGTNSDHTTAFAFDPNAPPSTSTMPATSQPQGTMAGTLPPPVASPRPQPIPQRPAVTPQPTPPPPTDTAEPEPPPPPPTETSEQEPEPEPEPDPPPPTNTDTSATSTQPPPPPPA